jgi:hypothetical protein
MTKPLQRRDTRHSGEGGVDAAAGIPRTFTTHSLYAESVSQSLPHSYQRSTRSTYMVPTHSVF